MIRLYRCFLLCLFFPGFVTKGQQLPFYYIGDKLNLPSQECYNVMQDSRGYIWISTELGICRYSGSSRKLFNKKNGISENSCYAIKESAGGKIWMLTSDNRIFF